MRVTTKGQVTIPQAVRQALGIRPGDDVEFALKDGKVHLVKRRRAQRRDPWRAVRGTATVRMSTDEIMALTRERP